MKHNKKPSALRVSKAGTAASWMLLLVYLSPLYLVFSIALKSKEDFAKNGFAWPKTLLCGIRPDHDQGDGGRRPGVWRHRHGGLTHRQRKRGHWYGKTCRRQRKK